MCGYGLSFRISRGPTVKENQEGKEKSQNIHLMNLLSLGSSDKFKEIHDIIG